MTQVKVQCGGGVSKLLCLRYFEFTSSAARQKPCECFIRASRDTKWETVWLDTAFIFSISFIELSSWKYNLNTENDAQTLLKKFQINFEKVKNTTNWTREMAWNDGAKRLKWAYF